MTDTAETARDFDGCNRECRKAGKHTMRWGGCEHAPKPEPTVSMSKVYTDPEDGYPSIGFDSYTVPELGELITAGLRASDLPVNGDDLVDVGLVAAHAIVHRNDPDAAASVVVPAADRAAPCRTTQHCAHHGFCHRCAPAFAAVMFRVNVAIQRTDPEEGHWGPLYEAVAAELAEVLPAPADRAAVLEEAVAELEALRDKTDVNVAVYPRYDSRQKSALNDGIARLRRMAAESAAVDRVAAETPPAETHSCRNCLGIDPDTCLMNPSRPAVEAQPGKDAETPQPKEA